MPSPYPPANLSAGAHLSPASADALPSYRWLGRYPLPASLFWMRRYLGGSRILHSRGYLDKDRPCISQSIGHGVIQVPHFQLRCVQATSSSGISRLYIGQEAGSWLLPPKLSPVLTRTRLPQASMNGNPEPAVKTATLTAERKERVLLSDYGDCFHADFPFNEFLCHPSGVEAMLNTKALQSFECLDSNTYRCTLPKIQFLKYEVIPVADLRLTYDRDGCIIEMLSCKFEGSEILKQQNQRFSAFMRNHITWDLKNLEPSLDFDVHLSVTLQIYTKPFTMLPVSAVETPGNLIMQGLVDRLLPLLTQQLIEEYQKWVTEREELAN